MLPKELIVDNFAGCGGVSKGIEMATGRVFDIVEEKVRAYAIK